MENKAVKYEKPQLKFVSMRSEENVADPCWSPNSYANADLYYDIPGKGYVRFMAAGDGDNCGKSEITILEYYNINAKDVDEKILINAVKEACGGGNSGNPYKESSSVTPKPDPSWS